MQVGDLVKHSNIPSLGLGLVTEYFGAHICVQWLYEAGDDRKNPGPTLERISMLEVISESR
tara:strand:+ start:4534 stop:4716 length:183 start_codon:yes stop_codon:yes gene_type:complete